jgi:hypothetical protein
MAEGQTSRPACQIPRLPTGLTTQACLCMPEWTTGACVAAGELALHTRAVPTCWVAKDLVVRQHYEVSRVLAQIWRPCRTALGGIQYHQPLLAPLLLVLLVNVSSALLLTLLEHL